MTNSSLHARLATFESEFALQHHWGSSQNCIVHLRLNLVHMTLLHRNASAAQGRGLLANTIFQKTFSARNLVVEEHISSCFLATGFLRQQSSSADPSFFEVVAGQRVT